MCRRFSEQRIKINRLSFEATLWLPEKITIDLNRVLQNDPAAPNMFDILLRTRTHLSGAHQLTIRNVTQWGREHELPNRGLPPGFKNGQVKVIGVSVEINGVLRQLSNDELLNGFQVPDGSSVHFEFPNIGEKIPKALTSDVRFLRLIEKVESMNEPIRLTIAIFPQYVANKLNQEIFGNQLDVQVPPEDKYVPPT